MTRWLQAALSVQPTTDGTDKTDETPSAVGFQGRNPQLAEVSSVVSVLSVERKDAIAAAVDDPRLQGSADRFLSENNGAPPDPNPPKPSAEKSGCMVATWSGVWVSADAWAAMTDLERYGPQGQLFCGKCWQYRDRDAALSCLDGRPCR